ncbi:hypothetical protein ACFWCA_19090 [Streptomyces phaeochromogenes]|uniref:hypothetical protein n=1 Tax=Streptomyces phaeochromogenes TaxID=1923 RepID=UPI003677A9CA
MQTRAAAPSTWVAGFRYALILRNPPTGDARTALADANIALSIAAGAPLDDIDPATGDNLSRQAYARQRDSWRTFIRDFGLDQYTRPGYEGAREYWANVRPAYIHDWPILPG